MSAKTATILLVDDEPHVTDALLRVMRRQPYELLSANSAARAQELLESHHVDVVVSDEQMPGVPGSAFLAAVRKQFPDTIRIILSGQASLDAAVRAINEGEVYRFLLKPCNPVDLIVTIQQALSLKRLELQSRRLLREFQRQAAIIEQSGAGVGSSAGLNGGDRSVITAEESDCDGDLAGLIERMEHVLNQVARPA